MIQLNPRERELVSLGSALASNCVPCIEYHIPEARKAGLTDAEISEAIGLADKVRQTPARKVLETAQKALAQAAPAAPQAPAGQHEGCGGMAATMAAKMGTAPGSTCCG